MVLEPPHFLVRSDGEEVRAPRYDRARERKLRRAQATSLARPKRAAATAPKPRRRVAQIQERTANLRQEFLRQLSPLLVLTWSVPCFEQVSLKALARTQHAKSWRNAAFGELLRQVEYKARSNSRRLVELDRLLRKQPC